MTEEPHPAVRDVIAALPDRPLAIWEYNTLTMDATATLPPQIPRPICDFRERAPTDRLSYLGDVVCKAEEWNVNRAGIVGFRFQVDQTWVSVGFEDDSGWMILHTDPVGKKGLGVVGDRIAAWGETFYGELEIARLNPLQCCAGAAMALLPSGPITENTLTSIFSDTIYQTHPVKFTVRPLATVMKEGTTYVIAFQYKLQFPDWNNWVCHGSVVHRPSKKDLNPGCWRRIDHGLDNLGDDGVLHLEDEPTEIAICLEQARLNYYKKKVSLEVPPPVDWAQSLAYILAYTPKGEASTPCDADVFTAACDRSYGLQDGEALAGLAGDGDPRERTVLGYHTGADTRVYSGLIPDHNRRHWVLVTEVPKTTGTGQDRPPHLTTTLEEWLTTNYGDHPEARSDRTVVPLVPWEPSTPNIFQTSSDSTSPSSTTAFSGKSPTQTSASSSTSSKSKPAPVRDPEVEAFVDQLAAETGVDRTQIIERYKEMKEYKIPDSEVKRATRATFTDTDTTEATNPTSEAETSTSNPKSTQDSPDRHGIRGIFNWLRG